MATFASLKTNPNEARLTAKITQKNSSTLPLLCYNETLCENESCYGEGTKWLPTTVVGLRLSAPKSVYLLVL